MYVNERGILILFPKLKSCKDVLYVHACTYDFGMVHVRMIFESKSQRTL